MIYSIGIQPSRLHTLELFAVFIINLFRRSCVKTSRNVKALLSTALYAENLRLSIVQPNGTSVSSL